MTEGWDSVTIQRHGETVEIVQANYDRTGGFAQVKGKANLDRLIAALKRVRKEMP